MIVRRALLVAAALLVALSRPAVAGPPYQTDDPEPADYRHYEIYIATEYDHDGDEVSGSLPLLDVNYGVLPNVQLTANLGFAYDHASDAPASFAPGSVELGVKYRFVQEGSVLPQMSLYPQVVIPGSRSSSGAQAQLFLPVWLQKRFGRWTAFGGGGRWINPGPGKLDYWVDGLAVTRTLSSGTTVGAEVYHASPDVVGVDGRTSVAVGLTAPIGVNREALLSVGRGVHGDNDFSGYLGYQIRLGPRGTQAP